MITKRTKFFTTAIAITFVLAAGVFIYSRLPKNGAEVKSSQTSAKSSSGEIPNSKATALINKTFKFNAINQNKGKKEVSFTIASVERKDEIRVKGEPKKAPKGYDFLLVRIEIQNTHSERLAIAPTDYIRLEDEDKKLYAPDYHNGNVILEPLSVKKDLLSFVVNKDSKNFTYQIGELDKNKETVKVNF